jgi:ESCRT-I complex subunit TSG101
MVHDPRVTSCLARLGGVYRDPARVDRDAASLLRSSVGSNLVPIVAEMYEKNGTRANVLVLQGTMAIHFKGNTYQILIDEYLPSGYVSIFLSVFCSHVTLYMDDSHAL